jgi:putative iron-regulated protein
MKKIIALATLATVVFVSFSACKKSKKTEEEEITPVQTDNLKKDVLSGVASNVIYATYSDMTAKANALYSGCVNFSTASDAASLATAQQAWKDVRSAWEQSEGFLFGPVSVDNIDPRIDTWPVDFQRLDSVLATSNVLTATYVDGLEESLKGFHPIEYLLFGNGGTKTAAQFTAREKDFLIALADNVRTLCTNAKTAWDPATSGNYTSLYTNANGGVYPTVRSAYEETIDAMAGICDEVANGKIAEPFTAEDASLEESPFAQNSLTDFTNNMKSVQNVYLGKYINDGKGLEDLIKSNNIAMDGAIKTKIAAAITSLNNITVPFGTAIQTSGGQRTQVQNAINAINDLKAYLEGDVKTYLQTITN